MFRFISLFLNVYITLYSQCDDRFVNFHLFSFSGKRSCLGEQLARMELFVFFTQFLHRYEFKKPTEETEVNIKPLAGGVLEPFPYEVCAVTRT